MNQPSNNETLVDSFGRHHDTLRVSVTDRCNLRCKYCMPEEGVDYVDRDALLSYEQLTDVVAVGANLGISRVRITGGEPLLREDLPVFLEMLRRETDIEDLSLTTNALLLDRQADDLAAAGLDRINVSLDSLDPERYAEITRFGEIEDVWEGIEAAAEAGIEPIKINTLVLEDFNDDEIDRWIDFVRLRDITVRFMELMPVGNNDLAEVGDFFDLTELRRRLTAKHDLQPASDAHVGNGPARYWTAPDWRGTLGFITPVSNSYCNSCSRLRLTCKGELRSCLAFDDQVKLAHAARRGDKKAIAAAFQWAVDTKRRGHDWNPDEERERTEMGMSEFGG
jgi:cyclic pyranopterin phosphate synthase